MNQNQFSWHRVMVFAGAYMATIIGAGFASGQELMQFFTYYGLAGMVGCLISLVAFAFVGAECLYRGRVMRFRESIKMFRFYCGNLFGTFYEYFIPLFLFGVYVIMISGAGATFSEFYGLNPYVGRVVMTVLALLSVLLGLRGMLNIVGNIGPVIVVFAVIIGVASLLKSAHQLPAALEFLKTAVVEKPASNAIMAGLLYPGYNMVVVVGLLSGMGQMSANKKECLYGGILGGVGLFLAASALQLAMLFRIGEVSALAIPSLFLAHELSPLFAQVFTVIILLGIYTTAAPLLWQSTNRFVPDNHPRFQIITVAIAVVGFLCGLVPFAKLVGIIYPYTGYVGIVILAQILYKMTRLKMEGRDGSDEMKEYQEPSPQNS